MTMQSDHNLSVRAVATKASWGIGSVVGAAILAWTGNFLSDGGIIRVLGGVSASQIINAEPVQAGTNCPDKRSAIIGDAKRSFCFFSDISIRQDNAGGWDVCKLEVGTGENAGKLLLTAQMQDGKCTPGAEISCKAKCIKF
jgi:hypothetical protein